MGTVNGGTKGPYKNICNLKGTLVFCPYRSINGIKSFSSGMAHKGWKDYQVLIHDTYYGGHIETDHRVICLIPEDVVKQFVFPNFITLGLGTLRGAIYNDTTTRDENSLDGLGMTKVKS